jgi:hypothetical protein
VSPQDRLDLARNDRLATAADHLAQAADHAQVSLVVALAEVAGVEPAVAEGRADRLGVVKVARLRGSSQAEIPRGFTGVGLFGPERLFFVLPAEALCPVSATRRSPARHLLLRFRIGAAMIRNGASSGALAKRDDPRRLPPHATQSGFAPGSSVRFA